MEKPPLTFTFSVTSPPRTKKNSPVPTQAKTKDGRVFTRILPSAAYRAWFKEAMKQSLEIRSALLRAGAPLPLRGQLACAVKVYRERNTGDLLGYLEGISDWMQMTRHKNGKTTRVGAGIIEDDRDIISWDGSRLLKDARCPRIEVELTLVAEAPPETDELFPEEEEEF